MSILSRRFDASPNAPPPILVDPDLALGAVEALFETDDQGNQLRAMRLARAIMETDDPRVKRSLARKLIRWSGIAPEYLAFEVTSMAVAAQDTSGTVEGVDEEEVCKVLPADGTQLTR